MVRIADKDLLEVGNRSLFVLGVLLKSLSKAEMGIDGIRVNLDRMFEVLSSPLSFTKVCQQVSKMDAGAKVVIVNGQTFFEILHAFFEVLHLLVAHTHVVERICLGWALVWVFGLDLDSFFKGYDCRLPF